MRMATEGRWRARKIQAKSSMLAIRVSLATSSPYLPKAVVRCSLIDVIKARNQVLGAGG
jgi:hypothetical protein